MNNTTEFHTLRAKGIGGSEIGSILGLNPYETPFSVWEKKTGRVPPFEGNKFTKAGNYLEAVVAKWFGDETGFDIIDNPDRVQYEQKPWCIGNPDRLYLRTDGKKCVLECKTTQKSVDPNDVPPIWIFQAVWYMGCIGLKHGAIAWLERGVDFKWIEIEFDEDIFEEITDQAGVFWHDHVLADVPPPPIRREDILKLYGSVGGSVEADGEMLDYVSAIRENNRKIKTLEETNEQLKEAVMLRMLDAENLIHCGKPIVTWKQQKTLRLNQSRLKDELPDVYEAYKDEIVSRVFRLSSSK